MGSRVLALFGSLGLAAACDSRGPIAPTPVNSITVAPQPPDASGPSVGRSNPAIAEGTTVESTVNGGDPVCFPNWDATGHCRQYDFVAASDGLVVATLTWAGPSRGLYDPDVFLVAPDGRWEYTKDAWPEKQVTIPARSGLTYRVVVMSYGASELSFALLVDVQS
jgi:hypothetical protein